MKSLIEISRIWHNSGIVPASGIQIPVSHLELENLLVSVERKRALPKMN